MGYPEMNLPIFCLAIAGWILTSRMFWARGYQVAALACALAGFGYALAGLSYLI